MPGTHFIVFKNNSDESRMKTRNALGKVLHMKDYKIRTISEAGGAGLYTTAFDGYPLRKWENPDFLIHLEGRIYGLSDSELHKRLFYWADGLSRGTWEEHHLSMLRSTDGEFLLVAYDKHNQKWTILSDAMNHLPFYWYADGSQFFASRELGLIFSLLGRMEVDPLSTAQSLVFLFPVGHRTMVKRVNRLGPASHLLLEPGWKIKHNPLFQWNFDERQDFHPGRSVLHLASLFRETCKSYLDSSPKSPRILSLSGGIDSRAVAAGLLSHPPCSCTSFLDREPKSARDALVASRVAEKAGCLWEKVGLAQVTGRDCRSIMSYKWGMSSLSMAFILPYFQHLLDRHGRTTLFFTGNTGMALRDYRPPRAIRSLDSLVEYIISRHHQIPIDRVEQMTGISTELLKEDLMARIQTYPERSSANKYVHFIMEGKCHTWHYENADLARYFFWPSAPLESTRFFNAAVSIPDHEKADFRLYRTFLMCLSYPLSAIEDSNTRLPFASPLFPALRHVLDQAISFLSLNPSLMLNARKRWTHKGVPSQDAYYSRCLRELIRSNGFPSWFCPDGLMWNSKKTENWSRSQLEILLTVMSVLREAAGQPSIWESYLDTAMT